MAAVASLQERIAASKRASAVERAWQVTKALEGDRAQIEGLQWVDPQRVEGKGITRKIEFAEEFPDVQYPVPLGLTVGVPANVLVPGESLEVLWTMPLLQKMSPKPDSLDVDVRRAMDPYLSEYPLRNSLDVVSFLPFPRVDAPDEEQFKPQFFVSVQVDRRHVRESQYVAAVVKYGGKVVQQYLIDIPGLVPIFADPKNQKLFSAEMLMNLSEEELAATPQRAGELEIYVYRLSQRSTLSLPPGIVYDFGLGSGSGYGSGYGSDSYGCAPSTLSGGSLSVEPTRGGSSAYRGLTSIHGGDQRPSLPSPAVVSKQVGDVRVGEGTALGAQETSTVEGLSFDTGFAVQRINLRILGVREGARDAAYGALVEMGKQYSR